MHWKSPQSPRKKKARMSKSKFKAMMIVFFDIQGVIYIDWVPEGQTVNQVYYKNVLTTLRERVRRRRPDVEEYLMDSSSRQRASTQRAICEEVFGKKQHSSDGTSTVLSGPSTVTFLYSRKSSLRSKEPGSSPWMQ